MSICALASRTGSGTAGMFTPGGAWIVPCNKPAAKVEWYSWRGRWYNEHEHSGLRNELGLVYRGWGHYQDEAGDL